MPPQPVLLAPVSPSSSINNTSKDVGIMSPSEITNRLRSLYVPANRNVRLQRQKHQKNHQTVRNPLMKTQVPVQQQPRSRRNPITATQIVHTDSQRFHVASSNVQPMVQLQKKQVSQPVQESPTEPDPFTPTPLRQLSNHHHQHLQPRVQSRGKNIAFIRARLLGANGQNNPSNNNIGSGSSGMNKLSQPPMPMNCSAQRQQSNSEDDGATVSPSESSHPANFRPKGKDFATMVARFKLSATNASVSQAPAYHTSFNSNQVPQTSPPPSCSDYHRQQKSMMSTGRIKGKDLSAMATKHSSRISSTSSPGSSSSMFSMSIGGSMSCHPEHFPQQRQSSTSPKPAQIATPLEANLFLCPTSRMDSSNICMLPSSSLEGTNSRGRTINPKKRKDMKRILSHCTASKINDVDPEEEVECCICLEELSSLEIASIDGCKHCFCSTCIEQWSGREKTCPLCKSRFTKIKLLSYPNPCKRATH